VAEFRFPAAAALNHLESIHRAENRRVVSLLVARMGAIAAGGSEEQVSDTRGGFADTFGLAFQITE